VAGVGIPGRGVGVTPCPIITPGTVGIIGGLIVGFGLGVMPGPRDGVIPGVGCICGGPLSSLVLGEKTMYFYISYNYFCD
jgi:hypothetical protein